MGTISGRVSTGVDSCSVEIQPQRKVVYLVPENCCGSRTRACECAQFKGTGMDPREMYQETVVHHMYGAPFMI